MIAASPNCADQAPPSIHVATRALLDVAAERHRQVTAEGWTAEHDDQHTDCQLAMAAALYAAPSPLYTIRVIAADTGAPPGLGGSVYWADPWPWQQVKTYSRYGDDFDPTYLVNDNDKRRQSDRRRNLVKAGALILAEIERLDRASA